MMHMTFYWSRQVTLLVDSWRTDSWTSYALTLLACFLASVFYQYLEDLRIRLKLLASGKPPAAQEPLLSSSTAKSAGKLKAAKLGGAAFFGINSGIGYLLMLAIMSFNGGVFLAIIGGLTAGYLFFRSGDEDVTVVVDNPCACA